MSEVMLSVDLMVFNALSRQRKKLHALAWLGVSVTHGQLEEIVTQSFHSVMRETAVFRTIDSDFVGGVRICLL